MRHLLRSVLVAAAIAVTHCATAEPVFAETPTSARAAESVSATPTRPTPPQETPAPADGVPAIVEEKEADDVEVAIEAWFRKHFHGLGGRLDEFLINHLRAAKDDLINVVRGIRSS